MTDSRSAFAPLALIKNRVPAIVFLLKMVRPFSFPKKSTEFPCRCKCGACRDAYACRAELPSYLMSAKAIAPRPAWPRRLIVVLGAPCRSMRGEIKSMKDVLSEIGTN
jgi:hypothetical protein